MIDLSRIIYRIAAWLFFACVIFQIFLAGLALFAPGISSWANHVIFGYLIGWLFLILIICAFIGRQPRAIKIQLGILLLLYIVQTILPSLRASVPIVAALHPVNAMLLFWFSFRHARQLRSSEINATIN